MVNFIQCNLCTHSVFYHHVKIGDEIAVAEKDSEILGRISDIGLFFVNIVTSDNKQISIPSNLFIQNAIKKDLPDLNNN
ncbi:mechanosensitive ion channel [Vicingaceae bacterium]|nr:mechanosensitive ion channel [Vicingaceae bacterium]